MRVRELERWLIDHGWRRAERVGGSRGSRACWVHPTYQPPLKFHLPHGDDATEIRPDVVLHILRQLERKTVVEVKEAS